MSNFSRIKIGQSDKKNINFVIESNYKINSIHTDPFGSTKMRFYYPSKFLYEIKQIEQTGKSNTKYKYEIQINNSANLGWSNDLTITCKFEEFEINHEFVNNYIPFDYGEVSIENINVEKSIISNHNKFKVGIIIPTFGRFDYLAKCLNSLIKCNLENCIIVIIDESVTKNIDNDKIKTNEYIKNFDFAIPTIKIYKNTHRNMFDSINVGLDILGNICEYLMTMDSDTIHNKNFILKTIQTYEDIKSKNPNKLIVISGFNTNKHKFTSDDNLNYCVKETIGGCHLCFKSEDYWNHIRYTLISYKWDTNISNLVNRINGLICTTKPSVVEHIGEISSVRNDGLIFDKSIDFVQKKYFIISEDLILENNQPWIIDVFKKEFIEYSNLTFVNDLTDSDVVWILGINTNMINKLKNTNLSNKIIITTIHHICWEKIEDFNKIFNEIKDITTKFHVICQKVYDDLKSLTTKPIVISNFWINETIFYNIPDKTSLRSKYNIPPDAYCVGSFQRDTEGKDKCMKPKLSKGPDIFIKIVQDMCNSNKNLLVILSGRRRNYIMNELEKRKINYLYYQMMTSSELNELYNCLDIYVVSSRVEGGPRAIIECAIAKIPIVSTNVGIADSILDSDSIYDMNNPLTYTNAKPNVDFAYEKAVNYSITNYIKSFTRILFEC